MTPRPYRAGERRLAGTQATRAKVVAAARGLLADRDAASFSIDAVAQRADVARMTVYYQFKSKAKLLEAVFDDLATRANMSDMRKVFQEPDATKALKKLVEVFSHLWECEGALIQRLAALAALDPEIEAALGERGSWRREALEELVRRLSPGKDATDVVDVLFALTSFETYRLLAGRRNAKAVMALLKRAAVAIVAAP